MTQPAWLANWQQVHSVREVVLQRRRGALAHVRRDERYRGSGLSQKRC